MERIVESKLDILKNDDTESTGDTSSEGHEDSGINKIYDYIKKCMYVYIYI
jgi:hypothetical protein